MKYYYYRVSYKEFWNIDSGIIKNISLKSDRSEILIRTTSAILNSIQTFANLFDFINYSNSNDFWTLDESGLNLMTYSPICDNPIIKREVTK